MIEINLLRNTINYQSGENEILNNGHTIQVNYKPGSTITVNGMYLNWSNSISIHQVKIQLRDIPIQWTIQTIAQYNP